MIRPITKLRPNTYKEYEKWTGKDFDIIKIIVGQSWENKQTPWGTGVVRHCAKRYVYLENGWKGAPALRIPYSEFVHQWKLVHDVEMIHFWRQIKVNGELNWEVVFQSTRVIGGRRRVLGELRESYRV